MSIEVLDLDAAGRPKVSKLMRRWIVRHKAKLIILTVAVALLLVAVVLSRIPGFLFFDRYAWMTSQRLSTALQDARSVVLVEHTGDIEIARRPATPEEILRLRSVISAWPRPYVSESYICWVPRHTIEIIRADGSKVNAEVCFECGKFAIDDLPFVAQLPPYLAKPLASFFTSVGMAPKTSDEYVNIEVSEHNRRSTSTKDQ